ncbi:HNH endonuclease [Wenzhouxiangella limi]|nr:HNH endonuclease [Wenzhouxiangella limi]
MGATEQDAGVRKLAFDWLERQTMLHGDVLPRELLSQGFEFEGRRVPFLSAQGIFKPAVCPEIPLTITTSPNSPYDDSFADEHRLTYRYRGTDPRHRDNVGLREAMRRRTPLIYLFGLVPGRYLPIWPVFVVGDDPGRLCFTVMADDQQSLVDSLSAGAESEVAREPDAPRRQYITAAVQVRLHQRGFRERVLKAYREQCALCRLKHRELLDASHIIPDHDVRGEPRVSNGLSLCKIHHTAFDRHFLGINPDGVIHIRRDLLEETDGPMLQHGLKDMHRLRLTVPSRREDRPDREALAERFEQFLQLQG